MKKLIAAAAFLVGCIGLGGMCPVVAQIHLTAYDIAANPWRYQGRSVRLFCLIRSIPQPRFANADCGPPYNRLDTTRRNMHDRQIEILRTYHAMLGTYQIVLVGPVRQLDPRRGIIFDGHVLHPMHGQNRYGVAQFFPAVGIDHIISSGEALRR